MSEYFDGVAILHIHGFGRVCFSQTIAVEHESHGTLHELLSIAVGVHELAKRRALLDFELNELAVLADDFQVQLLTSRLIPAVFGG